MNYYFLLVVYIVLIVMTYLVIIVMRWLSYGSNY